jgi:hypothetical protein
VALVAVTIQVPAAVGVSIEPERVHGPESTLNVTAPAPPDAPDVVNDKLVPYVVATDVITRPEDSEICSIEKANGVEVALEYPLSSATVAVTEYVPAFVGLVAVAE